MTARVDEVIERQWPFCPKLEPEKVFARVRALHTTVCVPLLGVPERC